METGAVVEIIYVEDSVGETQIGAMRVIVGMGDIGGVGEIKSVNGIDSEGGNGCVGD